MQDTSIHKMDRREIGLANGAPEHAGMQFGARFAGPHDFDPQDRQGEAQASDTGHYTVALIVHP